MEPTDLKSLPDGDDARLETWLRQPAAPLPDNGFSQRVLTALPTRAPQSAARNAHWPRLASCAVGAIVGILVARTGPTSNTWNENWAAMQSAFDPLYASFSDPKIIPALAIAAIALIFALRPKRWTPAHG